MKLPRLDTPHRVAVVSAIFGALLPTLAMAAAKKPELAAEPDIARLYAAGKAAKSSELLPGLAYRVIELADYGLEIHVWSFDQRRYRLRVAGQKDASGNRVAELLGGNDILAINGGFFERDKQKVLAPSGLLIVDGKEIAPEHERAGSGIVYANDNGVFIGYRKDLADHSRMRYAVQVGPVLVDPGGKVGVADKQHDRQNRSAICLARRRLRHRCGRRRPQPVPAREPACGAAAGGRHRLRRRPQSRRRPVDAGAVPVAADGGSRSKAARLSPTP